VGFLDILVGAVTGLAAGGPIGGVLGGIAGAIGGDDDKPATPSAPTTPTTTALTTPTQNVLQGAANTPQTGSGSFLQEVAQGALAGGALLGLPGAVVGGVLGGVLADEAPTVTTPGRVTVVAGMRKNVVNTVVITTNPAGQVVRRQVLAGRPAIMARDIVIAKRVFRTVRKLDSRLPRKTRKESASEKVRAAIDRRIIDVAQDQGHPHHPHHKDC